MRLSLIILSLILFGTAYAQVNDSFDDGDFTNNPTWTGDTSQFAIDSFQRLQLFAPALSDTSYLAVPCKVGIEASWSFLIQMDFNPSSANFAKVYLMSSNADLTGNLNGYFVKVGGTEDEVSLYRQDGDVEIELIDGLDKRLVGNVLAGVRVSRSTNHNWTLETALDGTGVYEKEGEVIDTTYLESAAFGVFCKYTSTRSKKMFFDDVQVTGTIFVDEQAPEVVQLEIIDSSSLSLQFSEPIVLPEITQLQLQPTSTIEPEEVISNSEKAIVVQFTAAFQTDVELSLLLKEIADLNGNLLDTAIVFTYSPPKFQDLVFNEVMADPEPAVLLPEEEYVELYNGSEQTFDLEQWMVCDPSKCGTILGGIIEPNETICLVATSKADQFAQIGNLGVVANFPALNNESDRLYLFDDQGTLIDSLNYSKDWYIDEEKAKGGWSLERIFYTSDCESKKNWRGSEATNGGTPGEINSIATKRLDFQGPQLEAFNREGEQEIIMIFDEAVNPDALSVFGTPLIPAATFSQSSTDVNAIEVSFVAPLSPAYYTVQIQGLEDCWGNQSSETFFFLQSDSLLPKDILINELLFNPKSGGADFIELRNVGNKLIDLSGCYFLEYNPEDLNITDSVSIGGRGAFFANLSDVGIIGSYVALTQDSFEISTEFQHGPIIEHAPFVNLPDKEGIIVLKNSKGVTIDSVYYSANWHHPILSDVNGVSLERISDDGESFHSSTWHSAAELANYGTPGLPNSQNIDNVRSSDDILTLSSDIISPDNDGFQDVLSIEYELPTTDYFGSITIFNSDGLLVEVLANNVTYGVAGKYKWIGRDANNAPLASGLYIIRMTAIHPQGEQLSSQKVVAIYH